MNNGALAIAISVHWILVRPRRSNYHQFKTYECHKTIYTLYSFLVLLLKAISNNSDFFNVESNWSSSFSNQSIRRSFRIILLNGFEFSVSSECHVALSITRDHLARWKRVVVCQTHPKIVLRITLCKKFVRRVKIMIFIYFFLCFWSGFVAIVSDDECLRYRFSFLLCSISH